MAKLPIVKTISREQFKDPPDWIDLLLGPINQMFEFVYETVDKDVTFNDNIRCQLKTIVFSTPSTYDGSYASNKFTPITFPRTFVGTAQGLITTRFYQIAENTVYQEQAIFVNWFDNNGTITINFISGLTAEKKYSISMLLF